MLTEEGCRARRQRLWNETPAEIAWIVITGAPHLIYFANFCPSPFVFNSQGAGAALILGRDGSAIIIADNVQESFLRTTYATEQVSPTWYRCVESAGHRTELLVHAVLERLRKCHVASLGYEATNCPTGLIDGLRAAHPGLQLTDVAPAIRNQRRTKHADEVAAVRRSLAAATVALLGAMADIQPGMTEFDAYRLVQRVAGEAAGCQVLVYGDFVSGPRCENGGGPPSSREIRTGDLVLLDFSIVIDGYRGDFCNTFVCGGRATPRQRELYEACLAAMKAGEQKLRPGVPCRDVHEAVREQFALRQLAEYFPHHAGHGVGLGHPELPFLVPQSSETLAAGDMVTLEPGVYLPGVAGMRFERNYFITGNGFELLSNHPISIDANAG